MSQSSFLDNIAQWSSEECRKNLDQALPTLTKNVTKGGQKGLAALKILCESFLPVCPVNQLEGVLSQIHDQVIELTSSLYRDLCETVRETNDTIDHVHQTLAGLLQSCMDVVGSMDSCVASLVKNSEVVSPNDIHSIPPMVLHILKASYSHCKDSSDIYGELLGLITEQLSALFKKAHSLQMNFIALMDKLSFVSPSDQDVTDLCMVISGLQELSVIAVSLDVKIMIVMWKAISRLACQNKEHLRMCLELDPILSSLITDMTASFTYLIQTSANGGQCDEKAFGKTVKVLGFQMKVLVTIVKEYVDSLDACLHDLVALIFTFQSGQPPAYQAESVPTHYQDHIRQQVTVALEPLVSYLIQHPRFINQLTAARHKDEFSHWVPLCMTLLTVMDMLSNYPEDIQSSWIAPKLYPEDEPRKSIIKAVFDTIPHCYVELSSPPSLLAVMCKCKPQRLVGLCEYICTKLCAFVASFPAQHFQELEQTLLVNLLSSHVHSGLMAADVWCFLARYGTADLCKDHCVLLCRLLLTSGLSPSPPCCHLVTAIRRLIKFLAPEHQEIFVAEFPVSRSLPLYSVLPMSVWQETTLKVILQQLIVCSTEVLQHWSQSSCTVADVRKLIEACQVLCNVYSTCTNLETLSSQTQQTAILTGALQCLLTLTAPSLQLYGPCLHSAAASSVQLLTYSSLSLDNSQLVLVLDLFWSWLKISELEDLLKLSVVYFIPGLSKKKFPPDSHQVQVLDLLSRLYSTLLADPSPLVHQITLENFAQFAEETSHETIVGRSLEADEKIQTAVVTYLNNVANGYSGAPVKTDQLLGEKKQLLAGVSQPVEQLYPPHPIIQQQGESTTTDKPSHKRQKTEEEDEISMKYRAALSQLKTGANSLTSVYSQLQHIPEPVLQELRQIHGQLSQFL